MSKLKLIYDQNFQNDFNTKILSDGEKVSQVTRACILVPEFLYDFFLAHGSRKKSREYFKGLLQRYRYILYHDKAEFSGDFNTSYQDEGQNLKAKTISLECETWAEIKALKQLTNWSCCKIMTYFLYLDFLGVAENMPSEIGNFITPENAKFFLCSQIYFNTKTWTYHRRFYYRRFDFHDNVESVLKN